MACTPECTPECAPECALGCAYVRVWPRALLETALAAGHYQCLGAPPQPRSALRAWARVRSRGGRDTADGFTRHLLELARAGFSDWDADTWHYVFSHCIQWPELFALNMEQCIYPKCLDLVSTMAVRIDATAKKVKKYSFLVAGYGRRRGARIGVIRELARLGLWRMNAQTLYARWQTERHVKQDPELVSGDADILMAIAEGLVPDAARLPLIAADHHDTKLLERLAATGIFGWWAPCPGLEYRYALKHEKRWPDRAQKTLKALVQLGCPVATSMYHAASAGSCRGLQCLSDAGAPLDGGELGAALSHGHTEAALYLVQTLGARWAPGHLALAAAGGCDLDRLSRAGCRVEGHELTHICGVLVSTGCRDHGYNFAAQLRQLYRLGGQRPVGDEPLRVMRASIAMGYIMQSFGEGLRILRGDFGCRPGCDEDLLELARLPYRPPRSWGNPHDEDSIKAAAAEMLDIPLSDSLKAKRDAIVAAGLDIATPADRMLVLLCKKLPPLAQ